jgi:hypothetical protein
MNLARAGRAAAVQTAQSLSRGGCQTRWHWLVNCDHGDSLTSPFGLTGCATAADGRRRRRRVSSAAAAAVVVIAVATRLTIDSQSCERCPLHIFGRGRPDARLASRPPRRPRGWSLAIGAGFVRQLLPVGAAHGVHAMAEAGAHRADALPLHRHTHTHRPHTHTTAAAAAAASV